MLSIRRPPLAALAQVWLRMMKGNGKAALTEKRLGQEGDMDGKARLILALLMSSVMVLMVTLLVTFLNLGLRSDFLLQWVKAYFIAWPVAAGTGFVVMPAARRLTDRIIARLDGSQ
jgi:Protein of unknown function (DUF2798)